MSDTTNTTAGEPLNLARACIEAWATDPAHADRAAFTFVGNDGDRSWTYAGLWETVQRIARGFVAEIGRAHV